MSTSEFNNRNIKKFFYSWLSHSETKGKILQDECFLSMHISNSLGFAVTKYFQVTSFQAEKFINQLQSKIEIREKNVAFRILFTYLVMKALVIYTSLHLKRRCWVSFGKRDFLSVLIPTNVKATTIRINVLDNFQADIYKTIWMHSLTCCQKHLQKPEFSYHP